MRRASQLSIRFSHEAEVGVKWTFSQPVLNQLRLVGSVVVHDEVNVHFFRHVSLDGVEEVAELFGALPLLVLADDLAVPGVERGEQTGCAVARIVVGPALDLPLPHGQQ